MTIRWFTRGWNINRKVISSMSNRKGLNLLILIKISMNRYLLSALIMVPVVMFFVGTGGFPLYEESKTEVSTVTNPITTLLLNNGSPFLGDSSAPITLVEFGDYQCHFCNVFFHTTKDILFEEYIETGKVKMIFKDYNIIGPDSITASHAAHCANDQGLFWEYHDVLYSNWTGENNGWASFENLVVFAEEIGLDMQEWRQCMADKPHADIITASNQDARALSLTGTPAFFVIGPDGDHTKIHGAQPFEVFERVFDSYT